MSQNSEIKDICNILKESEMIEYHGVMEDFSIYDPAECIETFEDPLKSTMKNIRDIEGSDVFNLLFEEYIITSYNDWKNEEEKKIKLLEHYKIYKEVYEKNTDLIIKYRAELGFLNPFSEFKPY